MGRLKSLIKKNGSSKLNGSVGRKPRKRQPSQLAFSADHRASTASSILQSLLTLYGLVVLMHGVVIPISDALAKPVEHAAYRQMFYIYMHGVGIACIVYLNWLISAHQRRAKKRAQKLAAAAAADADPTEDFVSEVVGVGGRKRQQSPRRRTATIEIPMLQMLNHSEPVARDNPAPVQSTTELVEAIVTHSDVDDQPTPEVPLATAETDFEDTVAEVSPEILAKACSSDAADAGKSRMYRPRRRLQRNPLVTDLPPVLAAGREPSNQHQPLSPASEAPDTPGGCLYPAGCLFHSYEGFLLPIYRESPLTPSAFTVSPITQSETGINLYLRLGAIVFGFGVMIHDGFKISEVIERKGISPCHDMWFIPKQTVHLVFIMAQTYYVFKHHRITFNTQLLLIRFMMVHLIVTNLCIWVKTVIYEIKVGLSSEAYSGNSSKTQSKIDGFGNYSNKSAAELANCHDQLLEDGPSHKLGPYLYPCAVEYGLICAAICFKVFSKIGDTKVTPYGRKMYPEGPRFTACHKSHKGLFLGLLIMICVLVPMISLQLLNSLDKSHQTLYVLVVMTVECAVLLFTAAMSLTGIVKTVRHLRLYKVRGNEAFDVNLLFVGLAGVICFNMFVSISVGSCAVDSNDSGHCPIWTGHRNFIAKTAGLKSILEVIQSISQTLFIMQGIQRRITLDLVTKNHKPGRGLTIGLLIANLAMWIEAVFEAKRSFAEDFPQEYFGPMAWSIVKYIFLPLIIFYRFHSSVCLSEIWIRSYKMPKKKAAE